MTLNNEVVGAVSQMIGKIAQMEDNIAPQRTIEMFLEDENLAAYVLEDVDPRGQRISPLASAVTIAGNIAAPMVKRSESGLLSSLKNRILGTEQTTSESEAKALVSYLPVVLRALATDDKYSDVYPSEALEMLKEDYKALGDSRLTPALIGKLKIVAGLLK